MEYDVTGIKLQYMDVRRLPHYTREVERILRDASYHRRAGVPLPMAAVRLHLPTPI